MFLLLTYREVTQLYRRQRLRYQHTPVPFRREAGVTLRLLETVLLTPAHSPRSPCSPCISRNIGYFGTSSDSRSTSLEVPITDDHQKRDTDTCRGYGCHAQNLSRHCRVHSSLLLSCQFFGPAVHERGGKVPRSATRILLARAITEVVTVFRNGECPHFLCTSIRQCFHLRLIARELTQPNDK